MKLAVVTTTINVPHALRAFRAADPDVDFFVIGDARTPHNDVITLCGDLDRAYYYPPEYQTAFGYHSAALLGFNTISRRNVGFLEALKAEADVIVSWDDDNFLLDEAYFHDFEIPMERPYNGLAAVSPTGWVDPSLMLNPPTTHRGFPASQRSAFSFGPVVGAKVGVAAGAVLGDPDIDAVTRMAAGPTVMGASALLDSGIVVDFNNWTVFNTQNTAIRREFVPAMLLCPQFGRFDDIFASLITQRVMREQGYCVRFGRPFVWQNRNPHDLVRDLEQETFGMRYIVQLAECLDAIVLPPNSVVDQVRVIYQTLAHADWMPAGVRDLAMAWCDDVEKVL